MSLEVNSGTMVSTRVILDFKGIGGISDRGEQRGSCLLSRYYCLASFRDEDLRILINQLAVKPLRAPGCLLNL